MKRLVIGVVMAAMSLALGSSAVFARAWDPQNPPPWIPLDANESSTRPSGDDHPWVDIDKCSAGGSLGYFLIRLLCWQDWSGFLIEIVVPAGASSDSNPSSLDSPQTGGSHGLSD